MHDALSVAQPTASWHRRMRKGIQSVKSYTILYSVHIGRDQWSYSMPGSVSTWMADHLWMGKPPWYVTSHPAQLSLAIPPWVDAMRTSENWGVNRHTARYTSPISVVSQSKLVSGWGLRKRRSAPPYRPCGSWRTLLFLITLFCLLHQVRSVSLPHVSVEKPLVIGVTEFITDRKGIQPVKKFCHINYQRFL